MKSSPWENLLNLLISSRENWPMTGDCFTVARHWSLLSRPYKRALTPRDWPGPRGRSFTNAGQRPRLPGRSRRAWGRISLTMGAAVHRVLPSCAFSVPASDALRAYAWSRARDGTCPETFSTRPVPLASLDTSPAGEENGSANGRDEPPVAGEAQVDSERYPPFFFLLIPPPSPPSAPALMRNHLR